MTIISGPVKPVYYHPDARQPTAAVEQGRRKAVYWLMLLAALISLPVGVLCLHESLTARTAGTDQLDFTAEGAPSHVGVTIDEALQGVSVRH
ncbi:MAG TPA: hypothetical protein VKD23_14255 [Terriglobales bacterium]|nr:hypothetical protein [Terriglobales bacterium]